MSLTDRLGRVLALIVGIEKLAPDQCAPSDGQIIRCRDGTFGREGIERIRPRVVIGLRVPPWPRGALFTR